MTIVRAMDAAVNAHSKALVTTKNPRQQASTKTRGD
jgi:hypothetical protein